ncbi:hypothetical protein PS3A_46570 [Pseudomonas sp. 3A(2025)]
MVQPNTLPPNTSGEMSKPVLPKVRRCMVVSLSIALKGVCIGTLDAPAGSIKVGKTVSPFQRSGVMSYK